MRTSLSSSLVGLALFGFAPIAFAADCESSVTAEEALQAEDGRYAIQAKQDYDAMQRIYGDDLVYIHSTSDTDNKASYIERQRAGLHYLMMKRDSETVRTYGCVAVITGAATFEVVLKSGDTRRFQFRFHSIWAKRGPDMRFVSWEATSIPTKP